VTAPAIEAYTETRITVCERAMRIVRGGTGEPVVFLHHSTGSLGWLELHANLAADFDILIPDMPGWNQSERPEWARSPRDIAALVNFALENLGIVSAHVVGFGFGGFVAAELAVMDPSRLRSLTLIGAAGLKPREGEIMDEMLTDYVEYVEAGFRDRAHFVSVFGEEPEKDIRELWDYSREMTARVCWKPFMFSLQLPHLLAEVETPALMIWGSEDRIVPPVCATQYAEALQNGRVELLPGAGHYVEFEETAAVTRLIADHVRAAEARRRG
jgi:pimeloyl-ACP methyl ester carboxylesterase